MLDNTFSPFQNKQAELEWQLKLTKVSKKIQIARLVCKIIPSSCPFARNIFLFGHILHIPPMCKLNPFYNYLMGLRWQALDFLTNLGLEEI